MRNKEIFCSFIVLTRWILVLLAKIKKTTEDFEEEKKKIFPLWRDVECNFTDFIQPRSVSYITISHPPPVPSSPASTAPILIMPFFFFLVIME